MNFVTSILASGKTEIEILLIIGLAVGLGLSLVGEVSDQGARVGAGHLLVRYAAIWIVVTLLIVVIFNALSGSAPAL
jgi:hypothetical protein